MTIEKLRANDKLPNHLAFIIDGNGRWARRRGLPRMLGHKAGFDNLVEMVKLTASIGIPILSVYAFSCENWNRPKDEVQGLMDLFRRVFSEDPLDLNKLNIKLIVSGELDRFDEDIRDNCIKMLKSTSKNTGMVLNLCINYGGRQEILRAVNNIISDKITNIDEKVFSKYLYTNELPNLDFIIRTSGELRTSNFMPFQSTYAEWYFPKIMWPAFSKKQLYKALNSFSKRDRRFGSIKESK